MITSSPPDIRATDKSLRPVTTLLRETLPHRPSRSTIHRWIFGRHGKGIQLPAIKIQNRWYTTPDAVDWFFAEKSRTEIQMANRQSDGVTDNELQSVGL